MAGSFQCAACGEPRTGNRLEFSSASALTRGETSIKVGDLPLGMGLETTTRHATYHTEVRRHTGAVCEACVRRFYAERGLPEPREIDDIERGAQEDRGLVWQMPVTGVVAALLAVGGYLGDWSLWIVVVLALFAVVGLGFSALMLVAWLKPGLFGNLGQELAEKYRADKERFADLARNGNWAELQAMAPEGLRTEAIHDAIKRSAEFCRPSKHDDPTKPMHRELISVELADEIEGKR
jgi:hypothetical protein